LRAALARFAHIAPQARSRASMIEELLTSGRLEAGVVDGEKYLWPAAAARWRKMCNGSAGRWRGCKSL
jgi:hypothetical protein